MRVSSNAIPVPAFAYGIADKENSGIRVPVRRLVLEDSQANIFAPIIGQDRHDDTFIQIFGNF